LQSILNENRDYRNFRLILAKNTVEPKLAQGSIVIHLAAAGSNVRNSTSGDRNGTQR